MHSSLYKRANQGLCYFTLLHRGKRGINLSLKKPVGVDFDQSVPPTTVHCSVSQVYNLLTVHLCGFSPVWRLMWTTSMYWALKGFCSREHSSQRHTNSFFSPWMWSLLMCCGDNSIRVNRHNVSQHTSSGDTEVVTRHQVNVCVSTCVCVCVCVLLKTSQQILVFFPPEDSPSFMCPHTHCEWRCHPLWLTVIMHLSTGDKNYKSTVAVVSGCVCLSVCVTVCIGFSRNRNFFRSQ